MAQIKQKASKDNKLKTPFCFLPHLQLQKFLLQFISLWKQLFTAAHGKYLASKQRGEAGKNDYEWILPKSSQGKAFHSSGHKLVDLPLHKERGISGTAFLRRNTAQLHCLLQLPGLTTYSTLHSILMEYYGSVNRC